MNSLDRDEDRPIFANDGIPSPVPDKRLPWEKQLAVYFVLISTFFERIAFFAFVNTLFIALPSEDPFNWNNQNSRTASYVFSGLFDWKMFMEDILCHCRN